MNTIDRIFHGDVYHKKSSNDSIFFKTFLLSWKAISIVLTLDGVWVFGAPCGGIWRFPSGSN